MFPNLGFSSLARQIQFCFLGILVGLIFFSPAPASSASKEEIALAGLEFGGTLGSLVWHSAQSSPELSSQETNQYLKLASRVKDEIEDGQSSSSLFKKNMDLIATVGIYAAIYSPEPTSKATGVVLAWAAKKTGDYVAKSVIAENLQHAKAVLAQGLKNSGLTPDQLKTMSASDLKNKVADLTVNGQKIKEIFHDQPDIITILEAHAVDLATNIGIEALSRAEGVAKDVTILKQDLKDDLSKIKEVQESVKDNLTKGGKRLAALEIATTDSHEKLQALQKAVSKNTELLQTIAEVSYSGWSTSQKLTAVRTGLFPKLNKEEKQALIEQLEAEQTREQKLAEVQQTAQDLGNIADIARNLGFPADTVKAFEGAQRVAVGIARFSAGDPLGGIAAFTSLVGLGSPDPASERHKAMMAELRRQFAAVHEKLDKIVELEVATLKAIATLAEEQVKFRHEVLGHLDRVEQAVLNNSTMLQAILQKEWQTCYALFNRPGGLNGKFRISNRETLINVLDNGTDESNAGPCYSAFEKFFGAWVISARWEGQIISADILPSADVLKPEELKAWNSFSKPRALAYQDITNFLLQHIPQASKSPAFYLARFSQPVVDANYAREMQTVLEQKVVKNQFDTFECDKKNVLSPGLRDLICFAPAGLLDSGQPADTRWSALLRASLIGPHAQKLLDMGIAMADLSDFLYGDGSGHFKFVSSNSIKDFAVNGPSPELDKSLNDRKDGHKGIKLLKQLQWLSEATVFQQGMLYGDYTAELVEQVLYKKETKSLVSDSDNPTDIQRSALTAMQSNPILARNVVMLAMRHALEDSIGGYESARAINYRQSSYQHALADFSRPQACNESSHDRKRLNELFPNWKFEYRVSKGQEERLPLCPSEILPDPDPKKKVPGYGSGIAVSLGQFYVIVPNPSHLSGGFFEQSDTLRQALFYRDRINQHLVDRTLSNHVRDFVDKGGYDPKTVGKIAYNLVNEAWAWKGASLPARDK